MNWSCIVLLYVASTIDSVTCVKSLIFVLAHYRTGSSLTGSLLSRGQDTFYFFEPLRTFGMSMIDDSHQEPARQLLHRMINCQFAELSRDFNFTDYFFVFNHDHRQINVPKSLDLRNDTKRLLYAEKMAQHKCNSASTIVIKTTRLSLEYLVPLLMSEELAESFDYHVVFLVRDPRAVYNSRIRLHWCIQNPWCIEENEYCTFARHNYKTYLHLPPVLKERVHLVKFEDLTHDPVGVSKEMYQKLHLPFTDQVRTFIQHHTNSSSHLKEPYSTYRNSSSVSEKWKTQLPQKFVKTIEAHCKDVLEDFNYL